MRICVALAVALALAGCANAQRSCAAMGFRPGTALYLDCVNRQIDRQDAASDRLMMLGTQMMAQPSYRPRPVTTTCQWVGGREFCSSY